MSSLKIKNTFTSYKELREAISRFEDENRVQFWKRDAKKIKSAEQYAPHIYQIAKNYPELEYYYLKFSCIHGGQVFRSNVTQAGRQRKHRGTWKQDCKAEISISLTKDRSALIINSITNKHNHKIRSIEEYKLLPKQRKKLEEEQLQKKQQLKTLKGKRTLSHVDTTKSLLKNVLKTNSSSRSNNFKKLANLLKEKYHCSVDLQIDEEDKAFGFFFQDSYMKTSFEYFPEILYIDGTYRLQNIKCCIYILYSENSFGTMDVVGVAVLTVEDKISLQWMIGKFQITNPSWYRVKIVVTDKFTSEYRLVQSLFPHARALICQFHALQVFKKEIKTLKLDLTQAESKDSLRDMENLMYASTEEEYNKILDEMADEVPYSLLQYLHKNWHETRSEWSTGFAKNLRKLINNKLESPNSKLKSVVNSCKNFNEFIEKLFIVLEIKRTDFKNEYTKMTYKVPRMDVRWHWKPYLHCLTYFAFTKIESFLKSEKQYSLVQENSTMICETKKKKLIVTDTSCSCFFFTEVKLPCRHVLFYRKCLKMDLFDEILFSEKWTKQYVRSGFEKLLGEEGTELISEEHQESEENEVVEDRSKEVSGVCTALATMCAESTGKEFLMKLNLLINLKRCWERGQKVAIVSNEETHYNIVEDGNGVLKEDIEVIEDLEETDHATCND